MTKKSNISVSLDTARQTILLNSAKKLGINKSELVRDLMDKYLDLLLHDENEIPVIIRIPVEVTTDREKLTEWFKVKTDAITEFILSKKSS